MDKCLGSQWQTEAELKEDQAQKQYNAIGEVEKSIRELLEYHGYGNIYSAMAKRDDWSDVLEAEAQNRYPELF